MTRNIKICIEISALLQHQFTGIPNVIREACLGFINKGIDCRFIVGSTIIPKRLVIWALRRRSGTSLIAYARFVRAHANDFTKLSYLPRKNEKILFTNLRPLEKYFEKEFQIIYDLSFFDVPEFHQEITVTEHSKDFEEKIRKNDINFCISPAVASSLSQLMDISDAKIQVIPLGMEQKSEKVQAKILKIPKNKVEPFCVVLGTLEPRKNIDLVLQFASIYPQFLENYRLVFIGGEGWGESFPTKIKKFNLEQQLENRRIVRIGFASLELKESLLSLARFSIFPSFYEGFGLPVLESYLLNTPVLASASTSIPFLSHGRGYFFNPESILSFQSAYLEMQKDFNAKRNIVSPQLIENELSFSSMLEILTKKMELI